MKTSFYSVDELKELGLSSVGEKVFISRKASIYNPSRIKIGSNVRIDDFCIISGNVTIGNNIHISSYSALFGGVEDDNGIILCDFATISSRACIYAISDDFSGSTLTNSTIPDKYRKVICGNVVIEKHAVICSGCTVLPGVVIAEGSAIGAMSLCKKSTEPWMIYAGIPAKPVKKRTQELLACEKEFLLDNNR